MEFPMFSWWNPNVFDGKHTFWCLSSPFFPIQSPCLVATHIFWGSNHYSYHQILAKTVIFSSGKTTTFHPKTTIFCGEDLPRSMGRRAPGLRSLPSGRGRRPLWRSTLQTTAVQGQGAPGDPGGFEWEPSTKVPGLVNCYITMRTSQFSMGKSTINDKWPFSIAFSMFTRGYFQWWDSGIKHGLPEIYHQPWWDR